MIDSVLDFSNLMKAWQRVKDNHGCPGVDGVSIEAFEKTPKRNMSALVSEITDRCYSPLPLLRLLVEKPSGGPRPLSIPAVRDRLIQTAVLNVVEPLFEQEFEQCSFAYRKGRSVKQAALQIREYRDQGYQYVVEVDIEAFFDNVDHQLLMGKVTKVLSDTDVIHLIERWITNHVWDGEKVYRLTKGIPQGSPISPILANLFLDELDETLLNSGYKLVRYSDDFVVLCKSKQEAETALELTDGVLEKLHLEIDEKDTRIVNFHKGFKYLGLIFLDDMILAPFDKPKRKQKVLYMPPPMNMSEYMKSLQYKKSNE